MQQKLNNPGMDSKKYENDDKLLTNSDIVNPTPSRGTQWVCY